MPGCCLKAANSVELGSAFRRGSFPGTVFLATRNRFSSDRDAQNAKAGHLSYQMGGRPDLAINVTHADRMPPWHDLVAQARLAGTRLRTMRRQLDGRISLAHREDFSRSSRPDNLAARTRKFALVQPKALRESHNCAESATSSLLSRCCYTVQSTRALKVPASISGQARYQFSTLGNSTENPNSLATNLGNNVNLLDVPGGGFVSTAYLFIQFGGFTFGKSASAYASPWQGFPGNISDNLLGSQNTDTGVNNIQYNVQFGNGVSGTIGLDDPTVWDRTAI
jgi:Porin subfamily